MSTRRRYAAFFTGIVCQSAGIALVVKSTLGTSPISSVPYVLSEAFPVTLGQMTLAVNLLFLLGQMAVLRGAFQRIQLMQAPVTLVFAFLIDVFMALFARVTPTAYLGKMSVLLLGAALVSLGVALQVIADVLMLSGEGIVYAIGRTFGIGFGRVKTVFDCLLVATGACLSLAFLGAVEGIREGTLISALVTGAAARFFIRRLSAVDASGRLTLRIRR